MMIQGHVKKPWVRHESDFAWVETEEADLLNRIDQEVLRLLKEDELDELKSTIESTVLLLRVK